MTKIGFIGTGNMGFAIINGILNSEIAKNVEVCAVDKDKAKLANLEKIGVKAFDSISNMAAECKYIFLAVKPQQLDEVLCELKGVDENNVIVSICAGIGADYIKKATNPSVNVVIVMPNTPLLLGSGATALAKVAPISDEDFEFVKSIFVTCGVAEVVSEDKMKEIIAINGSSPAFIYLYAKAFLEYAESVGIDGKSAKNLFAQSLIGSARMITESGDDIDTLIQKVSSKGGTTIAGLEKLREGNLENTVAECCKACTKRAYELAK